MYISEFVEISQRDVKLQYWFGEYRDYTQDKPAGYDHENVLHDELDWLIRRQDRSLKNILISVIESNKPRTKPAQCASLIVALPIYISKYISSSLTGYCLGDCHEK